MSGFNYEYKKFAKVAKDVGISREERRAIANNPKKIIPESENLGSLRLSSHALKSFFSSLNGSYAKPEEILKLGNYFYQYRGDIENVVSTFPNADHRLFSVGCKLVEDAFYSGQLSTISREQAAALTFVINVAAKVLENRHLSEEVSVFDITKAKEFVENVNIFQKDALSAAAKAIGSLSTAEQSQKLTRLSNLSKKFRQSMDAVRAAFTADGQSVVPYLMKSVLVASDMIGNNNKPLRQKEIRNREDYLISGNFLPGDALYLDTGMPSYSFYKERDKPYARQHFFPEEIPFAIWSLRYLRSRNSSITSGHEETVE